MQQEIIITFRFTVKHTPNNEAHLKQVAQEYLRSKGVLLTDELVIEV